MKNCILLRLRDAGIILVSYLALTLLLTWPLAANFATTLPDGSDGWQHLWGLWWMKRAIVDLHTNPYFTPYIFYPKGVSLLLHPLEPFNGLISIPFQVAGLGLPFIYNLLVVVSFVFSGYGVYLLVRYLTGVRVAAFVAGLTYSFSPYHFAHLLGQLNLASFQWLPFYVLALLKSWPINNMGSIEIGALGSATRPAKQGLWAAVAGVWLAINCYTEWTYGVILGLFTVGLVGGHVIGIVRNGSGDRVGGELRRSLRGSLLRLALLIGVWLALVAPLLVPMIVEARSATYIQATEYELELFSADLTDAFMPSAFHPFWKELYEGLNTTHYMGRHPAERVVFVGYSVLTLSVIALWRGRKRREVQLWAWSALGAWLLSLGPYLQVWGQSGFWGMHIPMPYKLLADLPLLSIMRVPSRFMVMAMLALAVMVGYALAASWTGRLFRNKMRTSLLAGGLIVAEFIALPFPLMQRPYDVAFYREIANEPGKFAVLDLPIAPVAAYMGYATVHGKPIVSGYLSRQPPDPFVNDTPVLRYLLNSTNADDPIGEEAARSGLNELRQANVRYVVVHWWVLYGDAKTTMRIKLDRLFPNIDSYTTPEGDFTVYQLGP